MLYNEDTGLGAILHYLFSSIEVYTVSFSFAFTNSGTVFSCVELLVFFSTTITSSTVVLKHY